MLLCVAAGSEPWLLLRLNEQTAIEPSAPAAAAVISGAWPAVAAGGVQDQPACRAQLVAMYSVAGRPDKLQNIDRLLVKYAGREAELLARVREKYGVPVPGRHLIQGGEGGGGGGGGMQPKFAEPSSVAARPTELFRGSKSALPPAAAGKAARMGF